jgi:hypothetical protein
MRDLTLVLSSDALPAEPSMQLPWSRQQAACSLLHAGFVLGFHFDLKERGDMFLRNAGWLFSLLKWPKLYSVLNLKCVQNVALLFSFPLCNSFSMRQSASQS